MDLWSLLQVVGRRWYVVLPLFALTAYSTVALTDSIAPEYEVSGAVLLVGPAASDEELIEADGPDNRLLQLSGSLGTVSEALGFTLGSQRVRSEFAEQGLLPDYEIGTDSRSPIMQFLVTGDDPALTVQTMAAIMVFVEAELNRAQDELGTPPSDRIELQRISSDNEPTEGLSSRRRSQIFLVAVGVLTALATAVSVDALLTMRRRRRNGPSKRKARTVEVTEEAPADDEPADHRTPHPTSSPTDDLGRDRRAHGAATVPADEPAPVTARSRETTPDDVARDRADLSPTPTTTRPPEDAAVQPAAAGATGWTSTTTEAVERARGHATDVDIIAPETDEHRSRTRRLAGFGRRRPQH